MHIQVTIDSRNSAIHNAHHTSLRPSSVFEPRHPSLKVATAHTKGTISPQEYKLEVKVFDSQGRTQVTSTSPAPVAPEESTKGIDTISIPNGSLTLQMHHEFVRIRANDPSAGSPTETLLRLLLPLSDKIY